MIEFETMSPFVPYSQFQAGVVQYRLWKKTGKLEYRENLDSLKVILKYLNRRWLVAGMCGGCGFRSLLIANREVCGGFGGVRDRLAIDDAVSQPTLKAMLYRDIIIL